MLGPVAPDKALAIANLGMQNPRIDDDWQIPMRAGQLLMSKEKMKYYRGQPMDIKNVGRARYYFQEAMKCPNASGIALRSYIRASAAMKKDKRPLEVKEIEAWYDHWKNRRQELDSRDFSGHDDDSRTHVSEILLTQMRIAKRRFPDDPKVEAMVQRIVREAFPDLRLDPVSLMPYGPGDRYSPHSGHKVEVYGVCLECGTVLKGRYCHMCGADSQKQEK